MQTDPFGAARLSAWNSVAAPLHYPAHETTFLHVYTLLFHRNEQFLCKRVKKAL